MIFLGYENQQRPELHYTMGCGPCSEETLVMGFDKIVCCAAGDIERVAAAN